MKISVRNLSLPLSKPFTIARTTFETARLVAVRTECDGVVGTGHGIPQPRFDDTLETSIRTLETTTPSIEDCDQLQILLPPGSARNALDMALWDLKAKRAGIPAWKLADLGEPQPIHTAVTVSLGDADHAFDEAHRNRRHALIKVKLGRPDDAERLKAVREAALSSRLITDANEAWDLLRGFGRWPPMPCRLPG
ncbi:hypothetical protein [Breoghania sp.]|uniref:hypothetical protein n=1 Tax=Breoghania sp. TaxID=2065378 RepID=UPI00260720F2|nr:hypothetical protein [Breoghania sp.]MDJ0931262.1 hypothetical protein [Breoghania sp.]